MPTLPTVRPAFAHTLLSTIAHPVASFHPRRMPLLTRRSYQLELAACVFFSVALAMVDGALTGVIVKKAFEGVVAKERLDYAVAVLAAAPEFTNATSFLWAAIAHGRDKVRLVTCLQLAMSILVGAMAFTPRTEPGLWILGACIIGARVAFAGVVTLRVSVWRANYPRQHRARVTGKLAIVQSIMIAMGGILVGAAMDMAPASYRAIFPAAAALGLAGSAIYSRVRLRRGDFLRRTELATHESHRPSLSPLTLYRTLASDRRYASFMLWLFILGSGNLMLNAPLIITLREQFHADYARSVSIVQTIPYVSIVLFVPMWARLLDRVHVVRFRMWHSWVFVVGQGLVLTGALSNQLWAVYLGMAIQGVGYAGAALAWNLGHLDFAPPHLAAQYMAVHLTLNGIRGILAPLIGVFLQARLSAVAGGQWVFAISEVLCIVGSIGYCVLARSMGPAALGRPSESRAG